MKMTKTKKTGILLAALLVVSCLLFWNEWNGYINRYVDTEDCRFRVNVNTDFNPTPLDYLQLK